METSSIELWHGSSHVIKHPEYGMGKPNNDYGRGFYCTRSIELAKEWACAGLDDGFANRYTLTTDGLTFLDLSQPPYTILNWLALLVENRRFQPTTAVAAQGIEYLRQVFLPDISQADVIVGYRADDSYFRSPAPLSITRFPLTNSLTRCDWVSLANRSCLSVPVHLPHSNSKIVRSPALRPTTYCAMSATSRPVKPTVAKVRKPILTACSCVTSSVRK